MATPAFQLYEGHHFDHERHPEVVRFQKEFDRGLLPHGVELTLEMNSVSGVLPNTDWSRLGATCGLLCAFALAAGVTVWVPFLNVAWGLLMLAMVLALPFFGARAALFRFRKGRSKSFRIDFEEGGEQHHWDSSDDWFFKPVKDFFRV